MKKNFILLAFLFSTLVIISSCGKKKQSENSNTAATGTITTNVELNIEHAQFDNNWNVQYDENKNLSKEEFDNMKLGTLSFMPVFGDVDFQIGQILFSTEKEKLLTVKAIASGEISEYLLSYINGNITDSLLVAYEDNVEYYSETSSKIENNRVTVTTVNRDSSGDEESLDSISTIYEISPKLTFDEVFEE